MFASSLSRTSVSSAPERHACLGILTETSCRVESRPVAGKDTLQGSRVLPRLGCVVVTHARSGNIVVWHARPRESSLRPIHRDTYTILLASSSGSGAGSRATSFALESGRLRKKSACKFQCMSYAASSKVTALHLKRHMSPGSTGGLEGRKCS